MQWQQLIIDVNRRVAHVLEKSLDGITPEIFNLQPNVNSNSIAWMVWHLSRVQDFHISGILNEEQLWLRDGWYARFGRNKDSSDHGYGHGPDDIKNFYTPDVETLVDYYRAVFERANKCIEGLTEQDLSRELEEPHNKMLPKVSMRIISLLSDNLQHAGQVAYLRGMLDSSWHLDG
jgi:hypothetical protein